MISAIVVELELMFHSPLSRKMFPQLLSFTVSFILVSVLERSPMPEVSVLYREGRSAILNITTLVEPRKWMFYLFCAMGN